MERNEVEKIFEEMKSIYLVAVKPSDTPTAYILGGQPSSGKSSLTRQIGKTNDVLVINGDNYRLHHPERNTLIRDTNSYSAQTQIFSNVFTEGLIKEAIKNRLSVSVEGTMRRTEVVSNTIEQFKNAGYRVELLCISAPEEHTAINLFARYAEELSLKSEGRLADLHSHQEACSGLLKTLDDAYYSKEADRIRIYEVFGQKMIADYTKINQNWSLHVLPSTIITQNREKQLLNATQSFQFVEKGINALMLMHERDIKEKLNSQIQSLLQHISETSLSTLGEGELPLNNLSDEIDRLTYGVEYFKSLGMDSFWNECKEFNESEQYKEFRKHVGQISISQAFAMALDNRSITSTNIILDTIKQDGRFHLRINGKPLNNPLDNDYSVSPKPKL